MVPDSIKEYLELDGETGAARWVKTYSGKEISKPLKPSHSEGYVRVQFYGKRYFVHKLMYWWYNGVYPDKVDHKDGNVENNRLSNLRIANDRQNSINRKPSGVSEFLGVYYHKKNNRWCSSIKPDKSSKVFLGSFTSEREAALVYNYKAKEVHGEFARFNQVF